MNPTVLVVIVAVTLAVLAVALNQALARVALVEVALNEGLPPGFEPLAPSWPQSPTERGTHPDHGESPTVTLETGVHVFLSRTCHACQRLLDELAHRRLDLDPLFLHYVDRPRPLARQVATDQGASLGVDEQPLAAAVGADPLPYTIVIGAHGLRSRSVSPTSSLIIDTARQAGIAPGAPT